MAVDPKKLGYNEGRIVPPNPEQLKQMQSNQTVGDAYNQGQRDVGTVGSFRGPQETEAMKQARERNQAMVDAGTSYVPKEDGSTQYARELGYFPKPEQQTQPQQGQPTLGAVTSGTQPPTMEDTTGGARVGEGTIPGVEGPTVGPDGARAAGDLFGLPGAGDMPEAFSRQLETGRALTGAGQQLAEQQFGAQEQNRRRMLERQLAQTNIADALEAEGAAFRDLSLAELEELAATEGMDLSSKVRDRLRQGGEAAKEALKLERGDREAELEFTRNRIEREYDRGLNEREKFNAQQDARLRKLVGAFGGGQVDTMGGNAAWMNAAEEGQRALDDMRTTYADQQTLIGRQADSVIRDYTNKVRQVEAETAGILESKYSEIQGAVEDLLTQGVTNQGDLNTALFELKKDYIGLYNDVTTEAANYIQQQNQFLAEQEQKLREEQFEQDKYLTDTFGVLYQGGQPVLDQTGMPMPTLGALKQQDEMDYKASMLSGVLYRNGTPVIGSNGRPVSTFDAQKFEDSLQLDYDKLGQAKIIADARLAQDVNEFNAKHNLNLSQQELDQLKFQADLAEKGITYGTEADLSTPTNSIRPNNSKYDPVEAPNGVRFETPTQNKGGGKVELTSGRRQCGEYVNDAIGIPGYFTNMFSEKKKKVSASNPPSPGSAFLIETAMPYGHVGMVEEVRPDGTIIISESNYDGKESFRRKETTLQALQARGLVGFTGGLKSTTGFQVDGVSGAEAKDEAYGVIADDIMFPGSPLKLSDVPQEQRTGVAKVLNDRRTEALKSGDMYGVVRATAAGGDLVSADYEKLGAADEVLGQLDVIEDTISDAQTGPITGALRSANPYDATAQLMNTQITQLVPQLARGVFGEVGVLTDTDVARYASTIPNINTAAGARQLLLTATRDRVRRGIESQLKNLAAAGKDVSGYEYLLRNIGAEENIQQNSTQSLNDLTSALSKIGDITTPKGRAAPLLGLGRTLLGF